MQMSSLYYCFSVSMAADPSPTSAMLAEELTSAKEKARLEQEIVEEGKRASHVRPWDKGKSESFII